MTMSVRVEKACTSSYVAVVETWEKGTNGQPDTLLTSMRLSSPAQLTEITLWQGRYIVVKEAH